MNWSSGGTDAGESVEPLTPMAGVLPPAAGEVHVWFGHLRTAAAADAWTLLSVDERNRALRFVFEHDRDRFVAARVGLRRLLAAYTGERADDLVFRYGEHGKPWLSGYPQVHFNVSHCDGLVVYAIAPRSVGIDVERLRPVAEMHVIADRYFSAVEQRLFRMVSAGDAPRAFLRCWTRKEAYLKCTGDGLAAALDEFAVSLDEHPRLLWSQVAGQGATDWQLRDVDVDPAYVGALALRGDITECRFHRMVL